jgi:amino acid permease
MIFKKKVFPEGQVPELDQVVDQLKSLDSKNKKLMYRMFILYLGFALFYLGLMILNPDPELTLENRIQGVLYVLIFAVAALFFRYHYRTTYKVDYTAPVLKMLEDARDRHRLLRPGKGWFLVFIIVVSDIVVTWAMIDHNWPDHWTLTQVILFNQAWYFAVIVLSFLIGYMIWRKKTLPLVRNLTRIIDELRSGDNDV